ncbi:hypothetical protein Tsubulata_035520 [Turnera subulata]|uniref:Geranylgeranyl transferase type-2 subunit alpha n=1 Tax=Turnera subulata TaxID=218843 RepID=A0A9Q0JNW7_9ROSI|nr:hypothetical protein Tsubulata_035520 [Turnera subulata]
MHGRPRKSSKPEDPAAEAAKAQLIRDLQSQLLANHHNKIYTKEALDLSAELLSKNPEFYTAWNYRKLAVQHALDSDPDSADSVLAVELQLAQRALVKTNAKAYGAWHHRRWVLSKGHSSLDEELRLLDELQKRDERNFHAWNHRRFVVALMNRSDEDELEHTKNMIEKTISNYSAWHNRSVILSNLMKKKVQEFSQKDQVLAREYEFVREALFTDEEDQSGWFYHLWLLDQTVKSESPLLVSSWPGHGAEVILLRGSYSLDGSFASPFNIYKSDSGMLPLILYFNQAVKGVSSTTVTVSLGPNVNKDVVWKPLSAANSHVARVWVAQLSFADVELQSLEACSVEVTIGESSGIFSSSGCHYSHPSRLAFSVNVKASRTESGGSDLEHISWGNENFHLWKPHNLDLNFVPIDQLSIKDAHEQAPSTWQAEIIAEEIKHFRDLLDCKIGKLTVARLLTAHDALISSGTSVHSEEILRLYGNLMKVDPTHSLYYKDEHSLALLNQLTSRRESLLNHCFQYVDSASSNDNNLICLRLNNLSLSRLGSLEKLLWVEMLDLSNNELQSIEGLEALQLLSHLSLSKNKLGSFTALAPLRQLKAVKVLDISYNEIGAHSIDTTRYLCSSPLSHSIESDWDCKEIATDGVNVANYWEAFFVLKPLKNLTQLDVVGNAIADENFRLFLAKVLPSLKWLDGGS